MAKHGISMYGRHKCRCEVCRAARASADARFKNAHPERVAESVGRYQRANPWRKHHLTNDGYLDLMVEQDGRCRGCGITLRAYYEKVGKPIFFQVDHDHACCPGVYSCGKCIRGLLCASCNSKDALEASRG